MDRLGVEVVGLGILVGGRCDNDLVGLDVGLLLVRRGAEVEVLLLQEVV